MFQGYTLHLANLKSCQLTYMYSWQLNTNTILNQEAPLSMLQVVIAYNLIINTLQTQNHKYTHHYHSHHVFSLLDTFPLHSL